MLCCRTLLGFLSHRIHKLPFLDIDCLGCLGNLDLFEFDILLKNLATLKEIHIACQWAFLGSFNKAIQSPQFIALTVDRLLHDPKLCRRASLGVMRLVLSWTYFTKRNSCMHSNICLCFVFGLIRQVCALKSRSPTLNPPFWLQHKLRMTSVQFKTWDNTKNI